MLRASTRLPADAHRITRAGERRWHQGGLVRPSRRRASRSNTPGCPVAGPLADGESFGGAAEAVEGQLGGALPCRCATFHSPSSRR